MASKQEKELTFELGLNDAALVAGSEILPAEYTTLRLRTVYFDTPAQDLMEAGFILKIREAAGRSVQI